MKEPIPLVDLLFQLEQSLKQCQMWQSQPPSDEELNSQQPFALDTLLPEQWLQWVFIPKISEMLQNQQVVSGFSISPYFEEVWKSDHHKTEVLDVLYRIDNGCR
ncbi:YqcC family protein [Vibrio sp. 99-8-1]|uniref:YqcC family protein n=1 Tax=Vibrio sp. 99-8-1 TaxID=2607602 RepID=UPI00149356EC|nr:YqcC family protein [Vibrio sp. 99-8-1]NOI66594.1 YqcC family protein [Vibrio sp. 99-8-1]